MVNELSRITNKEIREIHSYMEKIDNLDFVILLRKLLATFNFLLLKTNELMRKDIRAAQAEVKLENEKNKNKKLREKINEQKEQMKELRIKLNEEERNGERIFIEFKECVGRKDRLNKQLENLKKKYDEICNRNGTENKEE